MNALPNRWTDQHRMLQVRENLSDSRSFESAFSLKFKLWRTLFTGNPPKSTTGKANLFKFKKQNDFTKINKDDQEDLWSKHVTLRSSKRALWKNGFLPWNFYQKFSRSTSALNCGGSWLWKRYLMPFNSINSNGILSSGILSSVRSRCPPHHPASWAALWNPKFGSLLIGYCWSSIFSEKPTRQTFTLQTWPESRIVESVGKQTIRIVGRLESFGRFAIFKLQAKQNPPSQQRLVWKHGSLLRSDFGSFKFWI